MTDKAITTWTQEYKEHQFKDCNPSQQAFYQRGFVEGADWKEQQFKEYLEKRKESFAYNSDIASNYYWALLDEIINELFNDK